MFLLFAHSHLAHSILAPVLADNGLKAGVTAAGFHSGELLLTESFLVATWPKSVLLKVSDLKVSSVWLALRFLGYLLTHCTGWHPCKQRPGLWNLAALLQDTLLLGPLALTMLGMMIVKPLVVSRVLCQVR